MTVLGYLQPCDNCGVSALLAEETPRWTCRSCTGEDPEPGDPMERAYAAVREFFDVLQEIRKPKSEGAVLDTVAALDDDDPDVYPVGQVTG